MRSRNTLATGWLVLALGLCLIGLLPTPGQTQEILYGVTWDNKLITIDTSTGAGSLVGGLDKSMAAFGLGTSNYNLYAYDQNANKVQELDPLTGHTVASIDVGTSLTGEGGLTFRSDGIGFVCSVSYLYSFDLTGPSSTLIGALTSPGLDGLDFNSGGVLYGLTHTWDKLYTIDTTTAAWTLVGSTGIPDVGTHVGGLAFRSDDALFAAAGGNLYLLDATTGAATIIGDIGFGAISGLSFLTPIPIPGTMLLLGSGLLSLACLRRRK